MFSGQTPKTGTGTQSCSLAHVGLYNCGSGLKRVNNNTSHIIDSAELIAGASTLVCLKKDRKAASLKYRKKKHLKN